MSLACRTVRSQVVGMLPSRTRATRNFAIRKVRVRSFRLVSVQCAVDPSFGVNSVGRLLVPGYLLHDCGEVHRSGPSWLSMADGLGASDRERRAPVFANRDATYLSDHTGCNGNQRSF